MKEFEFAEFGSDFGCDIGFNKIFKRGEEKDGFIAFLVEIPKIKKLTNKECRQCGGSGKDDLRQDKCIFCDGKGKEYVIDWHQSEAVSASFSIFTMVLGHCEKDTSAPFPQLMLVETITRRDMHGGSLGGEISIPLRRWLISTCSRDDLSDVVLVMKTAYDKMFGLRDYHKFSFRVEVREGGGFIMDCPGDACGLHPADWCMRDGEGYRFSCHNVDTSGQQLTLLAGLAALHDWARKELDERR